MSTTEPDTPSDSGVDDDSVNKYLKDPELKRVSKEKSRRKLQNSFANIYVQYKEYKDRAESIMERQKKEIDELRRLVEMHSSSSSSSSSNSSNDRKRVRELEDQLARSRAVSLSKRRQVGHRKQRRTNLQAKIKVTDNVNELQDMLQDFLKKTYQVRLDANKTPTGYSTSGRKITPRNMLTVIGQDNDILPEFKERFRALRQSQLYKDILQQDNQKMDNDIAQRTSDFLDNTAKDYDSVAEEFPSDEESGDGDYQEQTSESESESESDDEDYDSDEEETSKKHRKHKKHKKHKDRMKNGKRKKSRKHHRH